VRIDLKLATWLDLVDFAAAGPADDAPVAE
jgi:hypothetical protein